MGHADSAHTAIRDIPLVKPDVVVIDVALNRRQWLRRAEVAPRSSARQNGPLRVLVLTNYTLAAYRKAATRLGADYFLDKSNQIPELLRMVRSLYRGANNGERYAELEPSVCAFGEQ